MVENSSTGISLCDCFGVVVSGNTVENCEDGISNGSYSSENVTISNNLITGCSDVGIDFHYLYNSTASGNIVVNNGDGIRVFDASACIISNNIVRWNEYTGIDVGVDIGGFENNVIDNNNTSNNGAEGIHVTCNHNTISNNISNGNSGIGIRLDWVGLTDINASYNIVSNNTCFNNNTSRQYYYVCINPSCYDYTDTSKESKIFPTDQTCILCGSPIYKVPYSGCHDLEINAQPNTLENNDYETSYIE